MRRAVKIKALSTRVPVRKAALSAGSAARRSFPAWIDAAEGAVAFTAKVMPRIRDGLVLRTVAKTAKSKTGKPENPAHGPGAR